MLQLRGGCVKVGSKLYKKAQGETNLSSLKSEIKMETTFEALFSHFKDLDKDYLAKKDDNLERSWLLVGQMLDFIQKKLQMKKELSSEITTDLTELVNVVFGLENKVIAVLVKNKLNNGEAHFLSALNPLRKSTEDWPPKSTTASFRVLEHVEAGLFDLAFYYNLLKDDLKPHEARFLVAKTKFTNAKINVKLEELLMASVRLGLMKVQKSLFDFESELNGKSINISQPKVQFTV